MNTILNTVVVVVVTSIIAQLFPSLVTPALYFFGTAIAIFIFFRVYESMRDNKHKHSSTERIEEKLAARQSREPKGIVFDRGELSAHLKSKILEQDALIDELVDTIYLNSRNNARTGPIVSILLVGPPGTGKTSLAGHIARFLYPKKVDPGLRKPTIQDEARYMEVSCVNMSSESSLSTLLGSGVGYKGDTKGSLIETIEETQGKFLILFDEIEKGVTAHFKTLENILLSYTDRAFFTSNKDSKQYYAEDSVAFMTSNFARKKFAKIQKAYERKVEETHSNNSLSAQEKSEQAEYHHVERDRQSRELLAEHFKPEFVNRLDLVLITREVSLSGRTRIAESMIAKLCTENGLELIHWSAIKHEDDSITDIEGIQSDVNVELVVSSFDLNPDSIRTLEKRIGKKLLKPIIEAKDKGAKTVSLEMVGNDYSIRIHDYHEHNA